MSIRGSRGFTLVEIMIVVAIIGLLATLTIPNLVRARERSQATACIDNLRIIDEAKQQWAMENRKSVLATPTSANLTPYIGRGAGKLPSCPIDSTSSFDNSYAINDVSTAPFCKLGGVATHVLH